MNNFNENVIDILEYLYDMDIDNLNILDFVSENNIHENIDFDEITDIICNGGGFDVEIIYNSKAMEYLSDNDSSLLNSLAIAQEMGYSPKDLNSEILASLLASEKLAEEWEDKRSEIESFLESLEWN